jgi:hypothetical protein
VDTRTEEILAQVAFKGAVDSCNDLDLGTEQGQGEFTIVFSFLHDSLRNAIAAYSPPETQAAQIIQGHFPGTEVVQQNPVVTTNPPAYVQPTQTNGNPLPFSLRVKGNQHGPLPDWLFEAAASKGVMEVYDNRDRAAANPKYPWFKATSGGPNAPAFWPPR